MPKPLIADAPYPTTDEINKDCLSLRIVSPAYATTESELNAVLQYVYHSFFFDKYGYGDIADTLISIAIAEMRHLQILGRLIFALGAAPVYSQFPPNTFNFYSAKYVSYSCTLKNMLQDDMTGEKRAIAHYERMVCSLKNEAVKNIIKRIIEDEKLHLAKLEEILSDFKC